MLVTVYVPEKTEVMPAAFMCMNKAVFVTDLLLQDYVPSVAAAERRDIKKVSLKYPLHAKKLSTVIVVLHY